MLTYLSNVHDIVNGILSDKQLKFVIDETTMGKELILYNVVIDGNNVISVNTVFQMDIYLVNII